MSTQPRRPSHRLARRRDRRVYTAAHPVLFTLLAAARRRGVTRLGRVLVVSDTGAFRHVLTRLPLDRVAPGTTGGATAEMTDGQALFDQDGAQHRAARRDVAALVGAAGLDRLRRAWLPVMDRHVATLAGGGTVDVVELAAEVAGVTAAALLEVDVDPVRLADAARTVAAAAVAEHLPGPRRARRRDDLHVVLGERATGLATMLALATVNTTVAAFPRAVAWTADAGLWADAADGTRRPVLVAELLRVTAASPMLPRVAAADGQVGSCPVRAGDRLVLMARDAAQAPWRDPDVDEPAPAQVAQLVFGAGSHACPGAGLARAQLEDLLARLAPYAPTVVRARPDRQAALPSWAVLAVQATARSAVATSMGATA